MQAINQCNERYKDHLETITLKFHFWVLVFANKNIFLTLDFNPPQTLSESEIIESINYLQSKAETNEFVKNNKVISCKIQYELGMNYYLINNYDIALQKFQKCLNILKEIDKTNLLYFERETLDYLIKNCEIPTEFKIFKDETNCTNSNLIINNILKNDIEMKENENESFLEEKFFQEKNIPIINKNNDFNNKLTFEVFK